MKKKQWLPVFPDPDALPVFQSEQNGHALFYAPGMAAVIPPGRAGDFRRDLLANRAGTTSASLRQQAVQAQEQREKLFRLPFKPVCLTLYLTTACELACVYCYASAGKGASSLLPVACIRAAAETVAGNCQEAGVPLTVVLHGGGEPTFFWQHMMDALCVAAETAEKYGLGLFRYIATNGMLDTEKADWLAGHFDRVGISCDGPDEIQARQRPRKDGGAGVRMIERAAEILRRRGTPFDVRVTVTPFSSERQEEIARYICEVLAPQEIHVEPVYRGGRAVRGFPAEKAEAYTQAFLRARSVAVQYGVRWSGSGSRPWTVHGPYCNIQRDVLNLMPDGAATACFKLSAGADAGEMVTGRPDGGKYFIDQRQIERLRRPLQTVPAGCQGCFNQFHCTLDCPDRCAIRENGQRPVAPFRCNVQQILADEAIREQAARAMAQPGDDGIRLVPIVEW